MKKKGTNYLFKNALWYFSVLPLLASCSKKDNDLTPSAAKRYVDETEKLIKKGADRFHKAQDVLGGLSVPENNEAWATLDKSVSKFHEARTHANEAQEATKKAQKATEKVKEALKMLNEAAKKAEEAAKKWAKSAGKKAS